MGGVAAKHISVYAQAFLPTHKLKAITPLTQGLINDSYHIETTAASYILQRLNTQVFTSPAPLMENIDLFQKISKPTTYQGPHFMANQQGKLLHKDPQGDLWRMQEFVPNSRAYDIAPNQKIATEAGQLLAQFHLLSQGENLAQYAHTIPKFQDIFLRLDQFSLAFKKADAALIKQAKHAIEIIASLRDFVTKLPKNLAQRLCHNDTKLNNMLFHEQHQVGLCLIDLDTLMPGYAFYDFGDAFRTIANTAKEGDPPAQVGFKREYAQAFIEGLATQKSTYSQEEWQSFALGAVYMPYIHGLRALTDYLEGNRYYKVSYAHENLDRSLSLLAFAVQAHEQQEFIEHCLQSSGRS